MTEQQNSSVVAESARESAQTVSTPVTSEKSVRSLVVRVALTCSVLAILVTLATGGSGYWWIKQQQQQQFHQMDQLNSQTSTLRHQQQELYARVETMLQNQQQALTALKQQNEDLQQRLGELQNKMVMLSGADANNWLLKQADFLVSTAGRKLWSDQDTNTALVLLKSADASLAQMHDPSLIVARRAITADIATISALNQVDYDGIILQINQLANQVDNLRLADETTRNEDSAQDSQALSSSIQQWRQNLRKSWQHFLDSFMTIRRRDTTDIPLLAPEQEIYLRENIRSRLLIAAQAVPRHQQEIYQQSLENVSTWVRAYYHVNDAASKAFLTSLEQLTQQSINMDLPDSLNSQVILEKLIQTRIRHPQLPAQEEPAEQEAP